MKLDFLLSVDTGVSGFLVKRHTTSGKHPERKQNTRTRLVKSYTKANRTSRTVESHWTMKSCFTTLRDFVTGKFIPLVQLLGVRGTAKLKFILKNTSHF